MRAQQALPAAAPDARQGGQRHRFGPAEECEPRLNASQRPCLGNCSLRRRGRGTRKANLRNSAHALLLVKPIFAAGCAPPCRAPCRRFGAGFALSPPFLPNLIVCSHLPPQLTNAVGGVDRTRIEAIQTAFCAEVDAASSVRCQRHRSRHSVLRIPLLVSGFPSWVSGFRSWVSGFPFWVAGFPLWVAGFPF